MTAADDVLVSSGERFSDAALAELREIFPELSPVEAIGSGILRLHAGISFDRFAARVADIAPIFVRHLAPVQRIVTLRGDEGDVEILRAAALALADELEPARSFAVQTRLLGDEGAVPYRRVGLNRTLSEALAERSGAVLDTRQPEMVVSVLVTQTAGYLGVSRTEHNRSAWPGGERRFRIEEGQISRAEFKLLEALEVFALPLPERGVALDIGAAPGGWTRVLRQKGLDVVAVDPADLALSLRNDPGVTHVRQRIQPYLASLPRARRFEMIVNDLKMDAPTSIDLLLQAGRHLAPNGVALITLKLPKESVSARILLDFVRADLRRLSEGYWIRGARQLFHNRSEVTVALEARRPRERR